MIKNTSYWVSYFRFFGFLLIGHGILAPSAKAVSLQNLAVWALYGSGFVFVNQDSETPYKLDIYDLTDAELHRAAMSAPECDVKDLELGVRLRTSLQVAPSSIAKGINQVCLHDNQNCAWAEKVVELGGYTEALGTRSIEFDLGQIQNEAKFVQKAGTLTPGLKHFYFCTENSQTLSKMVSEKMDGTLEDYMGHHAMQPDDLIEIIRLIMKLHGQGIAHGDLHPRNVLYKLDSHQKPKFYLIDFSYSQNLEGSNRLSMISNDYGDFFKYFSKGWQRFSSLEDLSKFLEKVDHVNSLGFFIRLESNAIRFGRK